MTSTQKEDKKEVEKHFIITHKDCNASFTVKSNDFCVLLNKIETNLPCPNCGNKLIKSANLQQVANIIYEYANVKNKFENADIRELKGELKPEKLRL